MEVVFSNGNPRFPRELLLADTDSLPSKRVGQTRTLLHFRVEFM